MTRILRRLPLAVVLLLSAWSAATAQEHSFGLRAGSFQFAESSVLTDPVHMDRRPLVVIDYTRDFASGDFDGTLLEATYEWRRDTDAHVSMIVSGGYYTESAMHTLPGTAIVTDKRGSGLPSEWILPTSTINTLEYTIYYFHFSPRWNFTTGKARFWVGGGLGLWANLWREVSDSTYVDVFSCDRVGPAMGMQTLENCTGTSQYRESDGNRRTVLPLSLSAGFTYQFLPHWSFSIEDRYLFNGQGSNNLFRQDSDFDLTGNQILVGVAYKL